MSLNSTFWNLLPSSIAGPDGHRRMVVRQAGAACRGHEARLGDVEPVGGLVEQDDVLRGRLGRLVAEQLEQRLVPLALDVVGILQELEPDQRAAGRAER